MSTQEEVISILQKNTKRIRNLCILAHVDHGKTTIADCLLASNGIISNRMAGKLRYMDSLQEEQERGITMKASAVSLVHEYEKNDLYLINLIDSPGHVDFSTEVSTAVRLCDNAIIVIDVCEGICPQTHAVLRQASIEKLKLIVVLNKLDRLIVELQMTPQDAYLHLVQILEQLNVLIAQQYASLVYEKDNEAVIGANLAEEVTNWTEDIDESKLYFSPLHNNVVFASALDGFGFSIKTFANIYANKLGIKSDVLKKTLWGDFFYNTKTKRIMKGAQNQGKKPLFVSLVLENLWTIYDCMIVKKDKTMMEKITTSLNIKILSRDLKSSEPKAALQALFNTWIPLSKALLDVVVEYLPGPGELTVEKVEHLMCSKANQFKSLPVETQALKEDFMKCSADESRPLIVYISKMFAADKENICKNKRRPLTSDELAEKREQVRQRKIEAVNGGGVETNNAEKDKVEEELKPKTEEESSKYEFLAFARVFSGTIKKGQTLYILLPKHNPRDFVGKSIEITSSIDELKAVSKHVTKFQVNDMFLMMGRELQAMDEVPSGNIIAIGGLEGLVLKSATLSSTLFCPSFTDMFLQTTPILRVAIEPKHPSNMKKLMEGLRLLNQSDPCVEIKVQSNGEHLLCTAGEVHLQRCIDDLVKQFAKCEVNVSPPRIPFRETVVTPPKFDYVHEKIQKTKESSGDGSIEIYSKDRKSFLVVKAKPLPTNVVKFIENNQATIKLLNQVNENESLFNESVFNSIKEIKENLKREFENADNADEWEVNFVEKIWSFGPNRVGSNLLINNIPSYERTSIWVLVNYDTYADSVKDICNRKKFYRFKEDNNIVLGFQLLTSKGPLCEEPLMGVCFLVDNFEQENSDLANEMAILDLDELESSDIKSVRSEETDQKSIKSDDIDDDNGRALKHKFVANKNQMMLMMKEACKRAFEIQPQRLMAAMYKCQILCSSEALGKVYAVLGKRDAKILDESLKEGTSLFIINTLLPVAESFGFAEELRKKTGGFASPHLEFSHFDTIDLDPFWEPKTEEEYLLYGDKADFVNKALKYVNEVRKRKGLFIKEKIVEHSEKQRTLGVK